MRTGATIAAVLIAVAAIAATWWVTRPNTPAAAASVGGSAAAEEVRPSESGPHPKVVIAEPVYEFGIMKMGDSGKHTFVVRNEGEAPLRLGEPRSTCQCTVSEAAKNQIPPGGEGTITLEWEPTSPTENFDKGAFISTNDPEMPEIALAVVGRVDRLVIVEPQGDWFAGKIAGNAPMEVTGYVYSRLLDDLQIEKIESDNPLLSGSAEPMSEEQLEEYEAKSGFRVVAKVLPGMPIGSIREPLRIVTNAEDEEFQTIEANVTGTHQGPVEILPTPGTHWNSDRLLIDLKRFRSGEGASGKVTMFVAGLGEEESLRFEKVDTPVSDVQLDLERDEDFQAPNRQKYSLTFTVKPGATPAVRRGAHSVPVTVTTNHPTATEMKFRVQYIAAP